MSERNRFLTTPPTPEQYQEWKAALERAKEKEAKMKARHSTEKADMEARHAAEENAVRLELKWTQMLVDAAASFVEAEPDSVAVLESEVQQPPAQTKPSTRTRRPKGKTWTDVIFRVLAEAGRGMEYWELREEVGKTHLGETLQRTDKSFYGGIGRLVKKRRIVRHGGRLYTQKAYHHFMADVEAGLAVDEPATPGPKIESPNDIAVLNFVAGQAQGATSTKIIDHILKSPPPDLKVTKNKGSLYNVLSRLVDKGKLVKRGDKYFVARQKSETPDPQGSSESHSIGGGESGIPSSSGGEGNPTSQAAPTWTPSQQYTLRAVSPGG